MIDEGDLSRLARYFAGECSAEEAEGTRAWLSADVERAHEADRLRDLWAASATPEFAADSSAAWQRLNARMQVSEGLSAVSLHETDEHKAPRRFRWERREMSLRGIALVAASVLMIVSAVAVQRREQVLAFWRTEVREPDVEKDREFRTARGQRAVIVLADGSRVELGAESVLRVRPFGAGARVLYLEGLAVFEVVHDTSHAFIVHSGNAITEDLGTRFTVRAYPGEGHVQVLVTSGKVALRAIGSPSSTGTLLGPADLGVLDSYGRATVRNGVDSSSYLAWIQDRFVFDNAPLGDVLPEIARWFDVKIDLSDPDIARRRVTMNVPARSLAAVLGAATAPLGLHYTTTDRTVVIR